MDLGSPCLGLKISGFSGDVGAMWSLQILFSLVFL